MPGSNTYLCVSLAVFSFWCNPSHRGTVTGTYGIKDCFQYVDNFQKYSISEKKSIFFVFLSVLFFCLVCSNIKYMYAFIKTLLIVI